MKNKIAVKLTMYFSAVLLLFSIIIGGVFMMLFRSHTIELYKTDLEKRAVTIAATLSEAFSETKDSGAGSGMGNGMHGGYGAYLRALDEIAMTDVWVVDENLQLITGGKMDSYTYADLPQDADKVVKEVFDGKTAFSEGFSNLLNSPTLTVGTPINSNGKVVGALLLHSPVEGISQATTQGFYLLVISVLAAMILAIVLSVFLSFSFTKPLKKIQNSAALLAEGDYKAKTGVKQNDEIGELAAAIDVLSEKLALASHESEQLLRLRREFVANISHELRTPVTVIRGSIEALCDEVVTEPEQVKSYYRQMLNESIYLQRIVNDLLDLSLLQNTEFKVDLQEISLCDVLNDVVRSAQQMALLKNVEIRQEQETDNCNIMGDPGRLRQMFLVVLDNAIKFSYQNGIVSVSLRNKTVSIKDNGIGIMQDNLPYVFDRFYSVKSEENKTGTGLGLAIAKQIADKHHIEISVNSKQNEGTEFIFKF